MCQEDDPDEFSTYTDLHRPPSVPHRDMPIVHCPMCQQDTRIPESDRTLTVHCSECRHRFQAPPSIEIAAEVIEEEPPAAAPPPPRPRAAPPPRPRPTPPPR